MDTPILHCVRIKPQRVIRRSEDHISKLSDDILVVILNFLTLKEAAATSVVSHRWKHKSNSWLDRISKLSDDILVVILNFLTLKEAAATSVISHRWKHLWKSSPSLDFDASKALDRIRHQNKNLLKSERAKYINWVNQVLRVHKGFEIEEFRICFSLKKSNQRHINRWLRFAFAKRVRMLELDLNTSLWEKSYALPVEFFLAQPHPDRGGISSSVFLDFKPLKTLSLKSVNVTDENLQLFLLNCPFLEHLLVCSSRELVNVEVSGQSLMLKSLEIYHCLNLKSIKIFNANLASFKFNGFCESVVFLLQDLPFLVEVNMGSFNFVNYDFSELSRCMSNLQTLTLRFIYESRMQWPLEFPELPRLKQLTLEISVFRDESPHLLGFASVVKAFPCLQKCTIKLNWTTLERTVEEMEEMEEIPSCPHKCLKAVDIRGYYGNIYDLSLAMYFIKNAVELEELIIDPEIQFFDDSCTQKCDILIEEEATARLIAKQQFESVTVAPHTKLMIL